jgi:replication factor C subunit 3/5
VLLVEVDRLTRQAQAGLRRTMEKCASSCRLILVCDNPSRVIDPLKSRCLGIRVPAPSEDDVADVLRSVAAKERVALPDALAARIAKQSKRNVRRAVLSLEECAAAAAPALDAAQPIDRPDWEKFVLAIAQDVAREQSPSRLLATREKLYELLSKCIPADVILKTLSRELLKNLDDELKAEVVKWAAFYEHRITQGSKEIFHLEAFVAKFMCLYKKFMMEMFA